VAAESIERTVRDLEQAGFRAERFEWSINFRGASKIGMLLSTEEFYREFPLRAVPADVHGILLRVASLDDTLRGKIKAWSDGQRRRSKQIKDLADIARLIEAHPELSAGLPEALKLQLR